MDKELKSENLPTEAVENQVDEANVETNAEVNTEVQANETDVQPQAEKAEVELSVDTPADEVATEPKPTETVVEPKTEETVPDPEVNYSEKSLSELVVLFEELMNNESRMKLSKDAEAIKSAFYKKLEKERVEAKDDVSLDNLTQLENGFKASYDTYRKEKAEHNAMMEKEREGNLEKKEEVIADLKALLEKQEDVNATFPAFREIQNRWRSIGSVPARSFRAVNDTYQLYVEQFYDMVKINRELRDLDFKKNLEVKEKFCEIAEKLAENKDVVTAFKELQKLHDQWKEYGPVAKQYREAIWDRFKAATAIINKKYQAHFEGLKEHQTENLAAKVALCEKVEELANKEVASLNEWNEYSKQIEEIQKEWKTIGFATKKENQKIYDRFRAACDKFYEGKRVFYDEYKAGLNDNLQKKISLCEAAEALKSSTEWRKATDQFINLQKQWKEIGVVPRKKSDQLWKRFRAACDEFFAERDKNAKPENNLYSNLKAKQKLVAEIKAYVVVDDDDVNVAALEDFMARWQRIGFVPYKEKDSIGKAYREALDATFPEASRMRRSQYSHSPKSERERLILKYNQLEQDIVTYENNIGFFAKSKNSEPLIEQMQEKINRSKEELKLLHEQIRALDEEQE